MLTSVDKNAKKTVNKLESWESCPPHIYQWDLRRIYLQDKIGYLLTISCYKEFDYYNAKGIGYYLFFHLETIDKDLYRGDF